MLGRNMRFGPLEADIVATDGKTLSLIEVRTRSRRSYQGGLASISALKKRNLLRTGHAVFRHFDGLGLPFQRLRIDVAVVSLPSGGDERGVGIEYIEGAIAKGFD